MLVIRKAVRFITRFPSLFAFAHAVAFVLGVWAALWSFGASGVVALPISQLSRWWILLVSSRARCFKRSGDAVC